MHPAQPSRRRRAGVVPVVCAALALALGAAGCGSDEGEDGDPGGEARGGGIDLSDGVLPETGDGGGRGAGERDDPELTAPPCPAGAANCARASGRIIYVEKVDPDGDGDAHFVLLSGSSITAPGISVIDVRPELRPSPLPEPGEMLAASGPVLQGSYGQSQIQADAVRVGD